MSTLAQGAMVATAADTVSLIETYATLAESSEDERSKEQFASRASELVQIGLGLLSPFDEQADGYRSRMEEAANRAFLAAGLDGYDR